MESKVVLGFFSFLVLVDGIVNDCAKFVASC
jgi:hypothetical protein